MKEIKGDLITLAKEGHFDVITHGVNCFCTMGAGIAVPMKENFGCDKFGLEHLSQKGNINKLGCIDWKKVYIPTRKDTHSLLEFDSFDLIVVNSYTQYKYGRNHKDGDAKPVDYEAIAMCMQKINYMFPNKTIGLPMIGAGLAGGDWNRIKDIIQTKLKDMNIIIVKYQK